MASLGLAGIIEITDAFDLGAPGVHVGGEFIFLRARVQEPVPRTFLVLLPGAADLGIQARAFLKYFRRCHEPEVGRLQLQLFFVRLGVACLDFAGGVLGKQRGHFAFGRHALLRKGLERREVTVDRTDLAHRQRILGDLGGVAVTAAVLVGLGEELRVQRALVARGLHQRDFERRQSRQVAQ